ncbi:methyltransferase domain-containing protein [Thiobacillus sp. 65-1402]|uniref:methyltransferase domain-containing protein n=1 Tax=Thiobacillus sp. 65-1402 TaxID=1895861 RepID=UPI0025E12C16|nr:methyltransferase domain-containing protein [Thiobacillus sp. 65-1402]
MRHPAADINGTLPTNRSLNTGIAPSCPGCGSIGISRIGSIPDAFEFAGRKLDTPLPGGSLYRCRVCTLHWRHPQPDKRELDALYRQGDAASWQYHPVRRQDWQIAMAIIRKNDGLHSVLDVGCFDGRFLDHLGTDYRRAGIEVHPRAAEHAASKGIQIVGRDFSDLETLPTPFDVVVAMDVIEHVGNPKEFLGSLAKATRPGGLIIVSTGNTAAWSWRLMRGMYWYCSIAEHLSFINPQWCKLISHELGLEITDLETFSHEPAKPSATFLQASANLFYRCLPNLAYGLRRFHALRKGLACRPSFRTPPHWRSARDHLLVAFRVPLRDGAHDLHCTDARVSLEVSRPAS